MNKKMKAEVSLMIVAFRIMGTQKIADFNAGSCCKGKSAVNETGRFLECSGSTNLALLCKK
jgi:hypothetical protein